MVAKLFDTLSARYAQRPGGYTRIIKLGPRRGDNAEMAIVELVGYEPDFTKKKADCKGKVKTKAAKGAEQEESYGKAAATKPEKKAQEKANKKEAKASDKAEKPAKAVKAAKAAKAAKTTGKPVKSAKPAKAAPSKAVKKSTKNK